MNNPVLGAKVEKRRRSLRGKGQTMAERQFESDRAARPEQGQHMPRPGPSTYERSEHGPVITFFLPWPDRRLSPNAREHWLKKARLTKKAREAAWATALEAKVSRISADRLRVSYTFCAPDKRHRDLDGAIGSMKAAQDGIADAVGIDDSKWTVSYQWGDPVPGGAVKVELEPA